ncbi:MAG TPA: S8 family serine peptidase [Jatrophihabitans sp.]|nr:S8 family serine peptidase [Jatrophihabitans sp.]
MPLIVAAGVAAALAVHGAAAGGATAPSGSLAIDCAAKVDTSLRATTSGTADVIVVGRSSAAVARAVRNVGGVVISPEPMVDGARASLPAANVTQLACSSAVLSVSPNRAVHFQNHDSELGTASDFVRDTGAEQMWKGDNGDGVGVAVIDTGISPMTDLGEVVYGPDLSGEGTIVDSYGHGTVMAGIIAGNGHDSATAADGPYTGMAPDTRLISVKVAGRNGATDVSTVLEAMHWVSAYQQQFNIRVLNLSWGTPATQSPTIDPLDYAVERLWRQGIVVVVAAGNNGPDPGTILKPADDPLVISVGAYDQGDTPGRSKDTMAEWSSAGPTAAGYAKPDLVAPGRTLTALRSYGSLVEAENPSALVAPSYIKGSGTSEAAAVTSGAVALLLAARPDLTPDQVKHILTTTAHRLPGAPANQQGAGRLDLHGAKGIPDGPQTQQTPIATGLGSLEASRGGLHVDVDCDADGTPELISGEVTADCLLWDPAAWTGATWNGDAWTGATWNGATWNGATWNGATWNGATWNGATWNGATWNGATWNGGTWNGATWNGATWNGATWNGATWNGATWNGGTWNGATWNGATWNGATWNSEFLTLWWGDEPAPGAQIAGETG